MFTQLSLWIVNLYLKSDTFLPPFYPIFACIAPEYGCNTDLDQQHWRWDYIVFSVCIRQGRRQKGQETWQEGQKGHVCVWQRWVRKTTRINQSFFCYDAVSQLKGQCREIFTHQFFFAELTQQGSCLTCGSFFEFDFSFVEIFVSKVRLFYSASAVSPRSINFSLRFRVAGAPIFEICGSGSRQIPAPSPTPMPTPTPTPNTYAYSYPYSSSLSSFSYSFSTNQNTIKVKITLGSRKNKIFTEE